MNLSLTEEDFNDLRSSGLNFNWITNSGARSISVAEVQQRGFYCSNKLIGSEQCFNTISNEYMTGALWLPFYDKHGNQIIDPITGSEIGVIKPRWIESKISVLKDKPPKYLCLPKSKQSRNYLHHPKGFDWQSFYSSDKERNLFITEGWKCSEAPCCLASVACVALYSVYSFTEGKLNEPLIPELIEALKDRKIKPVIVLDGDKSYKEGVDQAERMFVDKIACETGRQAYVINLPQEFNGQNTKGVDDFMVVAGVDTFKKLPIKSISTPFLLSSTAMEVPKIPRESLPETYQNIIKHIDTNYEGCLEIAPLMLFCQAAIALGNTFELNGKLGNFFGLAVAQTTSGKSSVGRQCIKALQQIDKELHDEYIERCRDHSKNDEMVYSHHRLVGDFTEAGLNHFLSNIAFRPVAGFLELEEMDNFLRKMNAECNQSLSSYTTKIYDTRFLTPGYSYERQTKLKSIRTIQDPAITIGGVGTEIGIQSAMPKNASITGFANRFQKFIGGHRHGKCIIHPKPIPESLEHRLRLLLGTLIKLASFEKDSRYRFKLSQEAEALYAERYRTFKTWEDKNQSNPLVPYFRRSLSDACFKLALQFQIISALERLLDKYSEANLQIKFGEWISKPENLVIKVEALEQALEWSRYFFSTAKYFYEKYESTDPDFASKESEAINILKRYPQGLLKSTLRRNLNLHRGGHQKQVFEEILEVLIESNEIEITDGKRRNSFIIKLKPHLLTNTNPENSFGCPAA
jgi:hypothetical protein